MKIDFTVEQLKEIEKVFGPLPSHKPKPGGGYDDLPYEVYNKVNKALEKHTALDKARATVARLEKELAE